MTVSKIEAPLVDVPARLRELADRIEARVRLPHAPAYEVAIVVSPSLHAFADEPVGVFGFGAKCDADRAHMLLALGQRKLEKDCE
jgi:hypothetical protein